jgi:DNA-binding IclR family transcriptional regulator
MSATDKLLAIFALFTEEAPEWTVEGAASHLGIATSTAYRLFKSLTDAGLIVAFASGRYVLGPAVIQLDRQIRLQDPLIRAAETTMKRLASESAVPATFLLCRIYRDQVICVHQEIRGSPTLSVSYERGRLMPLHRGAASKIILAHLPARTVRGYQRRHVQQIDEVGLGRSWETLKHNLRIIRNSKICVTHAELDEGAIGMGCALFAPDETVVGSLGLAMREDACTEQLQLLFAEKVRAAAVEIGERLRAIAS